jgi:hypothetical protein
MDPKRDLFPTPTNRLKFEISKYFLPFIFFMKFFVISHTNEMNLVVSFTTKDARYILSSVVKRNISLHMKLLYTYVYFKFGLL